MQDFNPETNSNVLPVEKSLRFEVRSFVFSLSLILPQYISQKLDTSDWCAIGDAVRQRAEDLLFSAASRGLIGDLAFVAAKPAVSNYAQERTYEQFTKKMEKLGIAEAWEVPASLQPTLLLSANDV